MDTSMYLGGADVQQLMRETGYAHDCPMCESFFGTLEADLLLHEHFPMPERTRRCILWLVEGGQHTLFPWQPQLSRGARILELAHERSHSVGISTRFC